MPDDYVEGKRDSSIIKPDGRGPITVEMEDNHAAALKKEIKIADLIAELCKLVPAKADVLEAKLEKYKAGRLPPAAMHTLVKLDVGVANLLKSYEKLAPGYDSRMVKPEGFVKPILV